MAIEYDATVARPVTYSGASGNVVVENKPIMVTGFVFNGGAAGATFRVFDNATTNSGTVLFAATVATATSVTYMFPQAIKALNGVTINASATGGAGAMFGLGGPRTVYTKSVAGAVATNLVGTAVAGTSFYGFTINAGAAVGAATVSFFDNATTSTGTLLAATTFTGAANASTIVTAFPVPVKVTNGITASVATNATGDITLWVG